MPFLYFYLYVSPYKLYVTLPPCGRYTTVFVDMGDSFLHLKFVENRAKNGPCKKLAFDAKKWVIHGCQ